MPSLKRLFGSPFGSHRKNKGRISNSPNKQTGNAGSVPSSPVTITTDGTLGRDQPLQEDESRNENTFKGDYHDEDDDDFRTTVMDSKSREETTPLKTNSFSEKNFEPMIEDDDFKTTVMSPKAVEDRVSTRVTGTDDYSDDRHSELAGLPTNGITLKSKDEIKSPNKTRDIGDTSKQAMNESGTGSADESPINSVVFENRIEIENKYKGSTEKIAPTNLLVSMISPRSDVSGEEAFDNDEEGGVEFDDHRSIISGLTEATNYTTHWKDKKINGKIRVPPSPTNSTNTAVTKKMEDFLKTETEAIRQILSTVDSGDDESTVVEESVRGANEAERMAREMEREMKLIVKGHEDSLNTTDDDIGAPCADSPPVMHHPDQVDDDTNLMPTMMDSTYTTPPSSMMHPIDSPKSDEFLADILSVIHPGTGDSDNKSLVSSYSHQSRSTRRSSSSSRRDLFLKRGSLYKLKSKNGRKVKKKNLRRCIKYVFRALSLALVICSTAFFVNWKLNFSDKDFSIAAKGTILQLERCSTKTTRATKSFLKAQIDVCRGPANRTISKIAEIVQKTTSGLTKERIIECAYRASSGAIGAAKFYSLFFAQKSIEGLKFIYGYALRQLKSFVFTFEINSKLSEGIQATIQYIRDRLEYTFTDRAAREQHIREELRLQQLLEAAAAAAAKEAAEKQQQLWTQTMFAGACAFIGSVATNYIWSAL